MSLTFPLTEQIYAFAAAWLYTVHGVRDVGEVTGVTEDSIVVSECDCCGTATGIETEVWYLLKGDAHQRVQTYDGSLIEFLGSAF